jgi:predicted nucleic acid-binding protein
MRVLVDADVLIDVALDRAPHAEASSRLLDALEARPGSGYVAWHSIANLYYLVAPARGRHDARSFVADLVRFIDVAPASAESVRVATRLPLKDFEDALQVVAALACGAEVIATRNIKDFRGSPVPANSPAEVAAALSVDDASEEGAR